MNTAPFKFPSIYEFPPFFTKQVNEAVWKSQLENWDKLLLDYCRHHHTWTVGVNHEVFTNGRIQRTLKPDTVRRLFEYMISQGHGQWNVKNESIYVLFEKPEELAEKLRNWVDSTGQNGAVLTIYELTQNDNAPLAHTDDMIVASAMDILVHRNQAVLMKGSNGDLMGVKIL